MSRWFRVYDELLDDPKVQRLAPGLFKTWMNILCAASRCGGAVPALSDLAFMLRRSEDDVGADVDALISAGLMDEDDAGVVRPHNWKGRQFQSDSSTERVQRFRSKRRAEMRNVSETPKETAPEAETDTEPDGAKAPNAREKARLVDAEFDSWFWPIYPEKRARPAALKAWRIARRTVSADVIVEGVRRYIQTKPPDQKWCYPATFLNQERWADEPADMRTETRHDRQSPHDTLQAAAASMLRRRTEQVDGADYGHAVQLPEPGDEPSDGGGAVVELFRRSGAISAGYRPAGDSVLDGPAAYGGQRELRLSAIASATGPPRADRG